MNDEITFDEDLRLVHITFFLAKRSHQNLRLDSITLYVDGIEVVHPPSGTLPAEQGITIALGMFEEGRIFDLGWKFRTSIHVPSDEVVLGHFPDHRITRATRFQRLQLESFQTYEGTVSVTVKRA